MKRLIICSDGTWQDLFKDYPTNVAKMAQAIVPTDSNGVKQIVYYDEGWARSKSVENQSAMR